MNFKKIRISAAALCAFLLLPALAPQLQAAVSKTSKRTMRPRSPVAAVVADLNAAALSTTSINWSWSTGTFAGIDGFYLYSSSTATKIALAADATFYIDAGLTANKDYTRWLTAYSGADEGSDSPHIQKYTYALPPAQLAISTDAPVAAPTTNSMSLPWAWRTDTIISTSAYVEIPPAYWFPNPVYASGYAVESSTDGGLTYVRERSFFVPWNTFPVISNRHYMVRVAAVNGDNEVTPGVYSATRTFTTPPLTPETHVPVARSSYTIEWRWDKDPLAGTEITGFRVYRSTLAPDGEIPANGDFGVIVATLTPNTSYWTEVYVDSDTASANSRHTRWVKAFGFLESDRSQYRQKYTYAVAPPTTTVVWPDPEPYHLIHVWENSMTLFWDTVYSATGPRVGIASQFIVDYSTTGGFAVAVATSAGGAPPHSLSGLPNNTRYDIRVGAMNGDDERTPADALNPFANSRLYRIMTRPVTPEDYACDPWTDTAVQCAWSTATYTNPEYISGYTLSGLFPNADGTYDWGPDTFVSGATNYQYSLDYLMTNSTQTLGIWVEQTDPDWIAGNPHFDAVPQETEYYYNHYGSFGSSTYSYTYATPPSDVSFATVAAHALGLRWLEPQVPATQYRVERSTSLGERGPWVFVSSVAGNTFYDEGAGVSADGLLVFSTYTYRIGAINILGYQTLNLSTATGGNRKDYSFARSTMTKHGAPAFYAVATGTTSIRWWWNDPSPGGVTSYRLYTSTDGPVSGALPPGTTYYDEVNLSSANARYSRRIRSVTFYDGVGDYAQLSSHTLVNAPASLAVTSTAAYTLTLGWPASENARYRVDRSTDRINWATVRGWDDVHVSTWFTDTGLRYASTYYYAVGAYNGDGAISLSSVQTSGVTSPLPGMYTPVSAAASTTVTAPLPNGGQVSVFLPAGTPDGYFWLSTSAATAPLDVSKNQIDDANARLTEAVIVPSYIVELHLFDQFGNVSTATLPSAARLTFTYPETNALGLVDGSAVKSSTLRLYELDEDALLWGRVSNSTLNTGAKTAHADLAHFSFYALAGDDFAETFKGVALSTTSIQWKWPTVSGADGYHLYTSSAGTVITVSSNSSSYIDAGLAPNKPYTRWVAPYNGATDGAASARVTKHTHALPPESFTLSTVTATSAYLEWRYSTATAYAVEGSTDGGNSYYRIRDSFVPWQTVTLLSNKSYLIRIGAINGDDELSPGYYTTVQRATTPPLNMTMSGVARSSYTIEWSWDVSEVGATGITGYNLYKATSSESAGPAAGETGTVLQALAPGATYWIENYQDAAGLPAANSLRARWIKAAGILESEGRTVAQRYTYAVAPSSCGLTTPDFRNILSTSLNLSWASSGATKYVVDYASATVAQSSASFSVGLASTVASGASASISGLLGNTKYDFRIGAINGDGLQTPDDALNPFAYSGRYKVITRPPETQVSAAAVTDTAIKWSWSTGTFTNMDYIVGYIIGIASTTPELGTFVLPIDYILGTGTTNYTLDYLITNSVHERYICPDQSTATYNYASYNGLCVAATGATFATPPNNVSFATVAAHSVGLWWNEPQVPATAYRVERSTTLGEDGPWVFISSVAGTSYLDTGLDISTSGLNTSTTYSYRIGAINTLGYQTLGLPAATGGNRRDYSFVASTLTVQRSPTLFAAAMGTATISWSWTNDVVGVSAFNIYSSTNGRLASGLSAATTYWIEVNLSSANTTYTRRIRSVTTAGESDYAEASTTTFALAPASLAASATALHTITLGWNGNGGSRYRLDRSQDLLSWTTVRSWADALAVSTYTDSGLHAAATYYYAVYAYNANGIITVSSAVSAGIRTLDLPAGLTQVFSTATASLSLAAAMPALGASGGLTVTIPAGALAADNYVSVSTSASTAPTGVTKAQLDSATAKLTGTSSLLPNAVVELLRWDMFGAEAAASFASPARVRFAYTDANNDGIVDGTLVDEDTLTVFLLDPAALVWNPQRGSVRDGAANTVYLDTSHFSIYALGAMTSVQGELEDVFAYPNPYRPGSSGQFGTSPYGAGIVFEGLPEGAKVRIYSLAGGLVRTLDDPDGDGRALWDARNSSGSEAASGVYVYVVSAGGSNKAGRVAIIK